MSLVKPSQNNSLLSMKIICDRNIEPPNLIPLKPPILLTPSHALLNHSTTIRKSRGYKGKPFLNPLNFLNIFEENPFINMKEEMKLE